MKLIYCPACEDIVLLMMWTRKCLCGGSGGRYLNEDVALLHGKAIPLGIHNTGFADALKNQPQEGQGSEFPAFVIPKQCDTVRYTSPDDFKEPP